MALGKCKECGNEVSSKATSCPKCGAPIKPKSRPVLFCCLLAVLIPGVFLVVGTIINMGKTGRTDSPSTTPTNPKPAARSASTATEKPEPKEKVYKMGDSVHVGYTTYALWKAWWSDRLSNNQFLNQPPNAKFLFIDITVRNNDKKARTIPPFKLIDEDGAEYDSDSSAWAIEGALGLLTDLNPSVSKQGFVVFDVPPERTYKLKVDGGFWSSESALIEIVPAEQN